MNDDLVAFLRARFDEATQTARLAERATGSGRWRTDWRRLSYHDMDARLISAPGEPVFDGYGSIAAAEFSSRQDPARVLADMQAKQQLLQWYEHPAESEALPDSWNKFNTGLTRTVLDQVLRHHAQVYADHPDYREEWRP